MMVPDSVLKMDPNNIEALLRLTWLKLHRGSNPDTDLPLASTYLEVVESLNRSKDALVSAKHETIFLDLKCDLLARTTTTGAVSSIKVQSVLSNFPRHLGLHLLLLDTFRMTGDVRGCVLSFRRWLSVR